MQTTARQFEFQMCIGRGGFGEVYKATMVSPGGLRKTVAVKALKSDLDLRSDAVRRLRDEARLLAQLEHRAILKVHDIVEIDGRVALVTPFLSGQDLGDCRHGPSPIGARAALEAIADIAGALHAASSQLNLVHRDIKPHNIRITSDGAAMLLDFGIARSPEVEREGHTSTGLLVGTLGYIAPERMLDESDGPSGDVFALGCVLAEALGCERVFRAMSSREFLALAFQSAAFTAHLDDKLGSLAGHPAEALVREMMALEPADRPSASDVERRCEDLAAAMDGPTLRQWARSRSWPAPKVTTGPLDGQVLSETLATGRADPADLSVVQPRKRELGAGPMSALAALAITLVVGGVGLWYWQSTRGTASPTPPAAAASTVVPGPEATERTTASPPPVASPEAATEPEPSDAPSASATAPHPPPTKPTAATPPARSAPKSTPAPAPLPEAPAAKPATLVVSGGTVVQLRGSAGTFGPGAVPAGGYSVFADFGSGLVAAGKVQLTEGRTTTLKCSAVAMVCKPK